jgi:hypothetical protein
MMRSAWFPLTVALIVGLWAYTRFGPALRPGDDALPAMPAKVADADERELYLTAWGKYTEADIAANGWRTASGAYPGFRADHDIDPQPGDPVCPITRTKADPRCRWVVGGHMYTFCCPPCIDEFVQLAKTEPDRLRPPGEYVRGDR